MENDDLNLDADNTLDLVTSVLQQKALHRLRGAFCLAIKGAIENVQHDALMTALVTWRPRVPLDLQLPN